MHLPGVHEIENSLSSPNNFDLDHVERKQTDTQTLTWMLPKIVLPITLTQEVITGVKEVTVPGPQDQTFSQVGCRLPPVQVNRY